MSALSMSGSLLNDRNMSKCVVLIKSSSCNDLNFMPVLIQIYLACLIKLIVSAKISTQLSLPEKAGTLQKAWDEAQTRGLQPRPMPLALTALHRLAALVSSRPSTTSCGEWGA